MNTIELIERFAKRNGLTQTAAKQLVDSVLRAITDAITMGEEVVLKGFGKFKVKHRAERTGRNPRTGAALKIAASKNVTFTPAKAMKTALNPPSSKKAKK